MRPQWLIKLRSPIVMLLVGMLAISCKAQNGLPAGANPEDARYAELSAKLDQVLTALDNTQRELAESRRQMHELELRIQSLDTRSTKDEISSSPAGEGGAAADLHVAVRQMQETTGILESQVKQHDQIKVESSSKYPIKISGMLLSTTNLNDGAVDNVDLPIVALPRTGAVAHGSLATTWRQTLLGLDARGPSLWGARSGADVHADFFGGQPSATGYSTNEGTLRLRTAHAYLDWPHSRLTASLDTPLISPLEPTSYLTVAEPAMAWSGNLWSWSPQLEFKHSIATSERGNFGLQLGLIDPAGASYFDPTMRQANPSESSKQPGYETRLSYSFGSGDHPLTIGASGYYARQKYPYRQHIDSWAGTADWKLPLSRVFELSGELYRGRALGELGGGAFKDYVPYGDGDEVLGLDDEGGWAQLKAKLSTSLEMNAAAGQDSAFAGQVRKGIAYASTTSPYSNLTANRTFLGNVIFRPRAYLLFSLEYRKITSWQVAPPTDHSQTVGLAIGYLY
jgi:hypothetical protein